MVSSQLHRRRSVDDRRIVGRTQDGVRDTRQQTVTFTSTPWRSHQQWRTCCLCSTLPLNQLPCRAQWLRGRAPDSRLREPGFESCAAVLKPWASVFTLHCFSSLSCINKYLTVVYMCTRSLPHINCSMWFDASQRSWDGIWLNRSVGEVMYKSALSSPMEGYCAI